MGWNGLYFKCPNNQRGCIDLDAYNAVEFDLHGGNVGGQQINVDFNCGYNKWTYGESLGAPRAGTWMHYSIELDKSKRGSDPCNGFAFDDPTGGTSQTAVYLDNIVLRRIPGTSLAVTDYVAPPTSIVSNGVVSLSPGSLSVGGSELFYLTTVDKTGITFQGDNDQYDYSVTISDDTGAEIASLPCSYESRSKISCLSGLYPVGTFSMILQENGVDLFTEPLVFITYDCTTRTDCSSCIAYGARCGWCSEACADSRDCTDAITDGSTCPSNLLEDHTTAANVLSLAYGLLLAILAV